jgi:hypothetical protein
MIHIQKELLLEQGPLVLALILSHAGLFESPKSFRSSNEHGLDRTAWTGVR